MNRAPEPPSYPSEPGTRGNSLFGCHRTQRGRGPRCIARESNPAYARVRTGCITLMRAMRVHGGANRNRTCSSRIKSSEPCHRALTPCSDQSQRFDFVCATSFIMVSSVGPERIELPVCEHVAFTARCRAIRRRPQKQKSHLGFPGRLA